MVVVENGPLLGEVVRRLRKAVAGLKKVIVFGSRAVDQARPESDFDLVIVVENDLPRGERFVQASRCLRGLGVAFDLVVLSPREFSSNSRKRWTVTSAAIDHGIVLYEAA